MKFFRVELCSTLFWHPQIFSCLQPFCFAPPALTFANVCHFATSFACTVGADIIRLFFAYNVFLFCDKFGVQMPPSLREGDRFSGGRSKNPTLQLFWNWLKCDMLILRIFSSFTGVLLCDKRTKTAGSLSTSRTLNRLGHAPRPHASECFHFCIIYRKPTRQGKVIFWLWCAWLLPQRCIRRCYILICTLRFSAKFENVE